MSYISGKTIRSLREKKKLTQRELGERLGVSEKTISKWETQRGLPDITLLEPLASELQISVAELLSGQPNENSNRAANMKKSSFYVCPVCGNIIHSIGEGTFSCCGVLLPKVTAEEPDEEHRVSIERIENDYYVSMEHPMSKTHYISFCAYVTSNRVIVEKLYAQQDMGVRFPICGRGSFYIYCNKHGLYQQVIR